MSYIKADNEKEQGYFDFLEMLRQSGETNMLGAARYLRDAFPDDWPEKKGFHDAGPGAVLTKWMKSHLDPARIMEKPNGT